MTGTRSLTAYRPYLASDLEWVIYSPPLLKNATSPDLSGLAQNKDIIEQVRRDPSDLMAFLQGMTRHNLGTYFEYLVFYWLDQLDEVQLLGTNLQVHDAIQTLGEFDLLFTYRGLSYHWELSVKFYANAGDGKEEADWLGPLKRDNLKKKLDRLFDHQLQLGSRLEAAPILTEKNIDRLKAYPFVKGMLFDHVGPRSAPPNLPSRISPRCTMSHWCLLKDLPNIPPGNATHYCLLYKPRWISPVRREDWTAILTLNDFKSLLKDRFDKEPYPILVAFGGGSSSEIEEYSRIFVMPDNWLPSHRKLLNKPG